jgi:myo-inositol-1(or 4)-monophosphatase
LIKQIHQICKSAGPLLLSNFQQIEKLEIEEKSKNDFVTNVDKMSEELIISEIRKIDSKSSFHAEESGISFSENKNDYWLIDPLDGTKNFIQGIPYFCISIAYVKESKLTLGAIYDPVHDDFFHAEKGKGAFRNNEKLFCSNNVLEGAFLSTGFPFRNKEILTEYMELFQSIFEYAGNIRRCGSAALDLAYVAAGKFDGFWEYGLKPWDLAAGAIIAEESGAFVTDFLNKKNYLSTGNIVAANKKLHSELITLIERHFIGSKPNDK